MWDPFRDIDRLLSGMNKTLSNASGTFSSSAIGGWIVATDVFESPTHYRILADIPGVAKEDVNVRVEEQSERICISGQRKGSSAVRAAFQQLQQQQHRRYGTQPTRGEEDGSAADDQSAPDERPLIIERDYGAFERCLKLPQRVKKSSAAAAFDNGVLEVKIEKESKDKSSWSIDVK